METFITVQLVETFNFKKQVKPKNLKKKQKKKYVVENLYDFLNVDKEFLMLLIAKYCQ